MKIIKGEVQPTYGEIERARAIEIGYLPQEAIFNRGRTLLDEVLNDYNLAINQLRAQEKTMSDKSHQSDEQLRHYGELQHKFDALGGWGLKPKALKIVAGLGFEESDLNKPIESFSAGWQMRISLARILLSEPNSLILDEPTNHLDIESIAWFEEYLDSFGGAILIVSHDRIFLDHVLNASRGQKGILEVDNSQARLYRSNFSEYLKEKAEHRLRLVKAAREQEKKISDIKKFIDRFHAHKDRAALVRSRKKMLEKIEIIEVEHERKKINVRFPIAPIEAKRLLTLKDAAKSYDGFEVFSHINMHIDREEKIALIGKNGAGKSTLCRLISGANNPSDGARTVSEKLVISSFFQDNIRELNPELEIYDWAIKEAPEEIQAQIRNFLGMFLFSGDDVFKKIGVLSGGEKTRLLIMAAMIKYSNLLILDEPTFHLDRDSIEALIQAVTSYRGAVLMVTHDRDLVANFAERIIELSHKQLKNYPGDYEYYLWKKKGELKEKKGQKPALVEPERVTSSASTGVEKKIKERKTRLNRIEEKLKKPDLFNDPKKVKMLLAERNKLSEEIESLSEKLRAVTE